MKIFDEELNSRRYSQHEKKILSSVKNNAVKVLTERRKTDFLEEERNSLKLRKGKKNSLDHEFQKIFKKSYDLKTSVSRPSTAHSKNQ